MTVWYPCSKKNIQTIENIQRRATRIVPDLKRKIQIAKFNLLIIYRRQRYDQIQIFKIIHLVIYGIAKPSVNKSLRLNSFPIRAIDSWNSLPESVITSDSVVSFKT